MAEAIQNSARKGSLRWVLVALVTLGFAELNYAGNAASSARGPLVPNAYHPIAVTPFGLQGASLSPAGTVGLVSGGSRDESRLLGVLQGHLATAGLRAKLEARNAERTRFRVRLSARGVPLLGWP